ncbi:MAG TPA: metallophosphoesterase [Sandaracinaceae bacterium LLY-WYZ-13_1]|nr:metallophosphoesterase [Sandaracinaceae bacterium LLY-WYZ-13_1]
MSDAPPSVDQAAAYAAERAAIAKGSHRALWNRFKRTPIELRQFAGPEQHVESLSHLRVAHLTDMHFGRVTPERVQREAVRITNAQAPDLVVITGDFVCHSQMFLDQLVDVLREIEAPTIGVLGNHDYWSGAGEVRRALQKAGVEILANRNTLITLQHERLQVVGLDDAYTGHADREAAVRGLRRDLPTIGLSHIAEEADWLWSRGVPLVLAGHTHAGQVTLARLHELAVGRIAGHKYIHGLYGARQEEEKPEGALYVGAGIGAAVMPFRFGERGRREVALFELGLQLGSIDEHHEEQPPLPGRKPSRDLIEKRRAMVKKKAEKRRKREARRNGNGNGNGR